MSSPGLELMNPNKDEIRLHLIYSLVYSMFERVERSRFLDNIHCFYKQFEPSVIQYLDENKRKIHTEMKNFIGLLKWGNYHSFWSIKASVDKCKKTIYKGIKSWESILRSSVKKIFDKDYSQGLFEKFAKGTNPDHSLHLKMMDLSLPHLAYFEAKIPENIKLPALFSRYAKIIHKLQIFSKDPKSYPLNTVSSWLIDTHKSWTSSILDLQRRTQELTREAPEAELLDAIKNSKLQPKFTEEKITKAKKWRVNYTTLQQNKRLLLNEWIKFLEFKSLPNDGPETKDHTQDEEISDFLMGLSNLRGKKMSLCKVDSRIDFLKNSKIDRLNGDDASLCKNSFMQMLGIRSCIPSLASLNADDSEHIHEIGGPHVVEKLISLLDDSISSLCLSLVNAINSMSQTEESLMRLSVTLEYHASSQLEKGYLILGKTEANLARKTLDNILANLGNLESTIEIFHHSLDDKQLDKYNQGLDKETLEKVLLIPYQVTGINFSSEMPLYCTDLEGIQQILKKIQNLRETFRGNPLIVNENILNIGLVTSSVTDELTIIKDVKILLSLIEDFLTRKSFPDTFVASYKRLCSVILSDCDRLTAQLCPVREMETDQNNPIKDCYSGLEKTFKHLLLISEDLKLFGKALNKTELTSIVDYTSKSALTIRKNVSRVIKDYLALLQSCPINNIDLITGLFSLQPVFKLMACLAKGQREQLLHLAEEATLFTTNYGKILGQLISKGFCQVQGLEPDKGSWADGKNSTDTNDPGDAKGSSGQKDDEHMTGLSENVSQDQAEGAKDVSDQVECRDQFEGLADDDNNNTEDDEDTKGQQPEDNPDGIEMDTDDFNGKMDEGDLDEDNGDDEQDLDDRMNNEDDGNELDRQINRDMWASESEDENDNQDDKEARDQSKAGQQNDRDNQTSGDAGQPDSNDLKDDDEDQEEARNDDQSNPANNDEVSDDLINETNEQDDTQEKKADKQDLPPKQSKPKEKSKMVAGQDEDGKDNEDDEINVDRLKDEELADAEREKELDDQTNQNAENNEPMDLDGFEEMNEKNEFDTERKDMDADSQPDSDGNSITEELPKGFQDDDDDDDDDDQVNDEEKARDDETELESSRQLADPRDNDMKESEETQINDLLNSGNQFGNDGNAPMENDENGADDREKNEADENNPSGCSQMQTDSHGENINQTKQDVNPMDQDENAAAPEDGVDQRGKKSLPRNEENRLLDQSKKEAKRNIKLKENSENKLNPELTNRPTDTNLYEHMNEADAKEDEFETALDAAKETELNKDHEDESEKKDDNVGEENIEMAPETFEQPPTIPEDQKQQIITDCNKPKMEHSKIRDPKSLPDKDQSCDEDLSKPILTFGVQRSLESTIHTQFEVIQSLNAILESAEFDTLEKLKRSIDDTLQSSSKQDQLAQVATTATESDRVEWNACLERSQTLARSLSENLRLVLEPMKASRMTGDFKTGKRLNMRKIIPYIASNFRKDKIWLRRSKPSKRDYRIIIAIDDSSSMSDNLCRQMTFEALTTVLTAFNILEVGRVGICSFGENVDFVHDLEETWSDSKGPQVINKFSFSQKTTSLVRLITDATRKFLDQQPSTANTTSSSSLAYNLLLILSDGIFSEDPSSLQVKAAVRMAREANIFPVCMIFDDQKKDHSIFDLKRYAGPGKLLPYMDLFPLPYYFVVRDVLHLPNLIADALRQWFELTTAMSNFNHNN